MSPTSDFWNSSKTFYVPLAYLVAAGVVVVLVCLVALSKWSASTAGPGKQTQDAILRLVNQASQWSVASAQDSSLLLRLIHANYAVAYLRAAKLLASEIEIKRITSINVFELQKALEDQQADEIRLLASECPALKLDGDFAVSAGWI